MNAYIRYAPLFAVTVLIATNFSYGQKLRKKVNESLKVDGSGKFQTNVGSDFLKPEPAGWFAGDIHVHRNCGGKEILPESKLSEMMEPNDLAVISVLADMGNGEVLDTKTDLPKVN